MRNLPVSARWTEADRALERVWVERAQRGDAHAFRAIFERYAPGIRRFLGDLLRDRARGEEATQEVFVRAYRKLGSLNEADKLQGWLFGIARFVAMEMRRELQAEAAEAEAPQVLHAVLPAPTPESLVLDQELEGALNEALAQIPSARRAALLMRVDHGLGYEDICAAMGWNLAKVKNEIHRARVALRLQLARTLRDRP